jgi:hypothetical protein
MNDQQYLDYCRALLTDFSRTFATRTAKLPQDHPLRELALAFTDLDNATAGDLYTLGPELASRLFDTYPEFAPTFPRQLLWFLGGDCLHYMPDEEIALYQQLEDLRLEAASSGKAFNIHDAKAKLMKLQ